MAKVFVQGPFNPTWFLEDSEKYVEVKQNHVYLDILQGSSTEVVLVLKDSLSNGKHSMPGLRTTKPPLTVVSTYIHTYIHTL